MPPPPPPPPSSSPVVSAGLSSRAKYILLAAVLAVFALIVIAGLRAPPTPAAFESYIARELKQRGVSVNACFISDRADFDGRISVTLTVFGKRHADKNYPEATAQAFGSAATQLGPPWTTFDFAEWQRVQQLLRGPGGPRLAALAGLEAERADLASLALVVEEEVSDASVDLRPKMQAERAGLRWKMTLLELGDYNQSNANPLRKIKDYPGRVCVVNRSEGRDELTALASRLPDLGARLDRAVVELAREQKVALLALLQPQALFAGSLVAPEGNDVNGARIFLEITEVRADEDPVRLSALMRNDGSWQDTRIFAGQLEFTPASGRYELRLTSPMDEASEEAGPILAHFSHGLNIEHDAEGGFAFSFGVEGGALTWERHGNSLRLTRVPAADRAALIASVEGDFPRLQAATRAGMAYNGAITNRVKGTRTGWILRFTGQTQATRGRTDALELLARLEHTERLDWKCALAGSIEPNRYRAKGWPLRLNRTYDATINPPAEAEEIFAARDDNASEEDTQMWLRLEGSRLVGENNRFVFRFEPASAEFIAEHDRKEAARLARLQAVVREGATYVGVAHRPDGLEVPVRLRIVKFYEKVGDVNARLEPAERPELTWHFNGHLNLADGKLKLSANGMAESIDHQDRTRQGSISHVGRGGSLWACDLDLTILADSIQGESEYLGGTQVEFPLPADL